MKGTIQEISNLNEEQYIRILYENAKWNRATCQERGNEEQSIFWSGTLNGLYSTLENLNITYEWLEGREVDFNQYYKSISKE